MAGRHSSGTAESVSSWTRVRTTVLGSSVSLRAVLENDGCGLGKDLVQFLHSSISAEDAMAKSSQLRQSLEVHREAIETFTDLLLRYVRGGGEVGFIGELCWVCNQECEDNW